MNTWRAAKQTRELRGILLETRPRKFQSHPRLIQQAIFNKNTVVCEPNINNAVPFRKVVELLKKRLLKSMCWNCFRGKGSSLQMSVQWNFWSFLCKVREYMFFLDCNEIDLVDYIDKTLCFHFFIMNATWTFCSRSHSIYYLHFTFYKVNLICHK